MPDIINTATLKPSDGTPLDRHQIYCGLDSCVTLEVHSTIKKQLDPDTQLIYDFERALQAPVLEMDLRGILTDGYEVSRLMHIYGNRKERIYSIVQRYAMVIWGAELNPGSHKQLKEFFYDTMNIPKIYKFDKGERKLTVNRDALVQIQQYRYARPIAIAVLSYRDMAKKIGVLKSGIDDDERMRFSWNIGGTNTGRFSANENVFGGGTNSQNITDELRKIFVANEGKKFAYLDLAQAESRLTAYISGDEGYISACEDEDLHTSVAKLIWPELDWSSGPNQNPAADRETAEQKFWRHWSYRDISKRGGHLSNYLGTAAANAKKLNISVETAKRFQHLYFKAFPGIRRMHTDVARELQTTAILTTPLGRRRLFFGRGYEDDILRKGVAYRPQSAVADILNLGMWRVWKEMLAPPFPCTVPWTDLAEAVLLSQLHDAILIQYDDDPAVERRVIARAIALMTIPVQVTDIRHRGALTREMVIPVDATVGWNWAKASKDNPDGLVSFGKNPERVRQVSPSTDLLQRIM